MKKLTILLLSVFMFSTYACSNTVQNNQTSSEKTTGKVIHLSKAEFLEKVYNYESNPSEWKYNGNKPAIVDFYADWCGPCRRLSPVLSQLADEYKDDIVIYKVDTEKERELAAAFGITSLPTLVFIPVEGQPQVAQGALPKKELEKAIQEVLLKK